MPEKTLTLSYASADNKADYIEHKVNSCARIQTVHATASGCAAAHLPHIARASATPPHLRAEHFVALSGGVDFCKTPRSPGFWHTRFEQRAELTAWQLVADTVFTCGETKSSSICVGQPLTQQAAVPGGNSSGAEIRESFKSPEVVATTCLSYKGTKTSDRKADARMRREVQGIPASVAVAHSLYAAASVPLHVKVSTAASPSRMSPPIQFTSCSNGSRNTSRHSTVSAPGGALCSCM
jgi:hypothetical protein